MPAANFGPRATRSTPFSTATSPRLEFSRKKGTAPLSKLPKTFPLLTRRTQHSRSLNQALSITSPGIRGMALERNLPARQRAFLWLHCQKGLQKCQGALSLTWNHQVHQRPQPQELHHLSGGHQDLAQRPS
jgi:hypothetical protein